MEIVSQRNGKSRSFATFARLENIYPHETNRAQYKNRPYVSFYKNEFSV